MRLDGDSANRFSERIGFRAYTRDEFTVLLWVVLRRFKTLAQRSQAIEVRTKVRRIEFLHVSISHGSSSFSHSQPYP
jgi:hypothetical protein